MKLSRIFIAIAAGVVLALPLTFESKASDVPPIMLPVATPVVEKRIDIDLSEQRLRFYYGADEVRNILISSGRRLTPTPKGEFVIQKKIPVMRYRGPGYDLPNTKWNLLFHKNYFIHGAYWHNNFGHPMSHGCINVAYKDMEGLYHFAEPGTRVIIHE
ncbi:MAG: L,D-transpeptidase [Patescibacteria group bacterium]